MKDGVTVVAMILIGSFVIDRLATALLFLLSFFPPWSRRFVDPTLVADSAERNAAERRQKLAYFFFAIAIAIVLVRTYPEILVLSALGIRASAWADRFFTLLALVGGSDRIAAIVGSPGSAKNQKPPESPIRVTGTLTLEDGGSGRGANPRNP